MGWSGAVLSAGVSFGGGMPEAIGRRIVGSLRVAIVLVSLLSGPAGSEPLEVGRIADLDLARLRAVLAESGEGTGPADAQRRTLSLEQSIAVALENNLGLQMLSLDVEKSGQAVRGAHAKFHPVAGVEGGAEGKRRAHSDARDETSSSQDALLFVHEQVPTGGSVTLGGGYSREFTSEHQESSGAVNVDRTRELGGLSIEVRQPLLRGGRIFVARRPILDAEYDREIGRARLRAEMLRVRSRTEAAYYQVVRARRQIEVIEQAIERDGELIRASQALFDAGRVSKIDVHSAEISLAKDRAARASSAAELELAQNELRRVLGLPIEVRIEASDRLIPFEPIDDDLEGWIRQATENRPELLEIRKRLEKNELALKVSRNEKLPELDVGGTYQPGFDFQSYNWRADLGFRIPIGNVAARAGLERVRIERRRLSSEYTQQKRAIELEVREVEIRLRENVKRLGSLIAQVESARAKGKIARGRFEMGLANNLDITNADEELIRAESELLRALVDHATNVAELEARIGTTLHATAAADGPS